MAELGGLSEKEIAPILGISTSTTYDIEESALRKLKNRVSHEKN
jgi:DNA-directed RNA polymerase specialized sigma subunit